MDNCVEVVDTGFNLLMLRTETAGGTYFGHSVWLGNGIINSSAFASPNLMHFRKFSNNFFLLNFSSKYLNEIF